MGLWILAIFGVAVLGVLAGLRGLGRPVPAPIGLTFFVLPVLFCLPGFLAGRKLRHPYESGEAGGESAGSKRPSPDGSRSPLAEKTSMMADGPRSTAPAPRVSRAALFVNNRQVAICKPMPADGGTFRWSFEADARSIGLDDVMSVRASTESGLESIVAMGTLRTHPPARI